MNLASLLAIVQSLLTRVQSSTQLKELGSKSELENLQDTMIIILSVLEDAERKKDAMSHEEREYVRELVDAVYDADDVLDEFFTLAERKQLTPSDKVLSFFSRFRPVALSMSSKVKKIRQRLDTIATNNSKFGFGSIVNYQPIKFRREDTIPHVYANGIIGRDDDVQKILHMLLDARVTRDVSVLSILGMGGLGKTALAQLIYGHKMILSAFTLRMWVCVADDGTLNISDIVVKILEAITGERHGDTTLDNLQTQLRHHLAGKKFLLVLDDMWTENRDDWLQLEKFLQVRSKGSWVVVTSRSKQTAVVVGSDVMYKLEGLSESSSWYLFSLMAFEQDHLPPQNLMDIGKKIVQKCTGVPLAIRVLGSLLYGQPVDKWSGISQMGPQDDTSHMILPILLLSYYSLSSELKSCFSYCAIFPKDYRMNKTMLINLWVAQSYITPVSGQTIEDTAEDYFMTLLSKCFFQDVEENEYGEIVSCQLHDLMHDMALHVSSDEIVQLNWKFELNCKCRHLSVSNRHEFRENFFRNNKIRTFLQMGVSRIDQALVGKLLEDSMRLRTLDLSDSGLEFLPSSIGKLLHLRYLDLSDNGKLKTLPKSITKLYNLHYFVLRWCIALKELPNGLSKLRKLRVLDIRDCDGLTHLPPGMGKLIHLYLLPLFTVGRPGSSVQECFDELDDLNSLTNLKDHLQIQIQVPENAVYHRQDGKRVEYLSGKKHLNHIHIRFMCESSRSIGYEEILLEALKPQSGLKELVLKGYQGGRTPTWGTILPNLVRLQLSDCCGFKSLPWVLRLHHLKFLRLERLRNLEYFDDDMPAENASTIFTILENLYMTELPVLKGWCRRSGMDSPHLRSLKTLCIFKSPEWSSTLVCPYVADLKIVDINRSIEFKTVDSGLIKARTNKVTALKLVQMGDSQLLIGMQIASDNNLESFAEGIQVFQGCLLSSVRSLHIRDCPKLKRLDGGLEHLSALEELFVHNCPNLIINGGEEVDAEDQAIPWTLLSRRLHSLTLDKLPQLVNLPEGIQYLPFLKGLTIRECKGLKSLPKWIRKLTALQQLSIEDCSSELTRRCGYPTGEDWSTIQHIPNFSIKEGDDW